jgi:hypothetical protein
MKQLPRETVEKTKPICKNEKTNLTFCLKMTYEEKCPSTDPKNKPNQTQFSIGACLGCGFWNLFGTLGLVLGIWLLPSNRGLEAHPRQTNKIVVS